MSFNEFKEFLINNKEWLAVLIPLIGLILTFFGFIKQSIKHFIGLCRSLRMKRRNSEAYCIFKNLENMVKYNYNSIKIEPIFFDELNAKKFFFYKNTLLDVISKRVVKTNRVLKKSYIIVEDAGCGKSAFLKNDFIRVRDKYLASGYIFQWFLNSNDLIEYLDGTKNVEKTKDEITKALYKKVHLYLDGVDEIGETYSKELVSFIKDLFSSFGDSLKIKITSRKEFADKYLLNESFSRNFDRVLSVSEWTKEKTIAYAKKLLKVISRKKHSTYNKGKIQRIYRSINEIEANRIITNPLLTKMIIYCMLNEEDGQESGINYNETNQYKLYSNFINCVVKTKRRRDNKAFGNNHIIKVQKEFAKQVFDALKNNKKEISLDKKRSDIDFEDLSPVYKKIADGKVLLVHETFNEFFIAYYYYNISIKERKTLNDIQVYCNNYSNDYADFITDALISDEENKRKECARKFIGLYYFTLDSAGKREYQQIIKYIPNYRIDLSQLKSEEFFSLKYELIFRLGRLNVDEDYIIAFLRFVYNSDANTLQIDDADYYRIMLKRCCAISSSFIGGEEIEIDYIKHMLFYRKEEYLPDYDLVNRSHTLLFYGDVKEFDIYRFRDDDYNLQCSRAFNKRINRLTMDLPDDVKNMEVKQLKKYYFRLFDLATVYCFIRTRNMRIDEAQKNIIGGCKVDFTNSSNERIELMREIKRNILLLIDEINDSSDNT